MKAVRTSEVPESIKTHSRPSVDSNLDGDHVTVAERGPDPLVDTQDGQGVFEGHTQGGSDPKMGGRKESEVRKTSVAERHVTSEPGFIERDREHKHVTRKKKETEKLFDEHRKKSSNV